jgi:hypothetical protein
MPRDSKKYGSELMSKGSFLTGECQRKFGLLRKAINIQYSIRYIFLVEFPIILIAFFLEKICCMRKAASLFPLPLVKEGTFPSLRMHSFTTASGFWGWGAAKLVFPGMDRM